MSYDKRVVVNAPRPFSPLSSSQRRGGNRVVHAAAAPPSQRRKSLGRAPRAPGAPCPPLAAKGRARTRAEPPCGFELHARDGFEHPDVLSADPARPRAGDSK